MKSNVIVEISNRQQFCQLNKVGIKNIIKRILEVEEFECNNGVISISFVTDEEIRSLNKQYLSRDYYTDVISFPFQDNPEPMEYPDILGEVIISIERAIHNQSIYNTSPETEVKLYIIHGILHLLRYNDSTEKEKNEMQKREEELLKLLEGVSPLAAKSKK